MSVRKKTSSITSNLNRHNLSLEDKQLYLHIDMFINVRHNCAFQENSKKKKKNLGITSVHLNFTHWNLSQENYGCASICCITISKFSFREHSVHLPPLSFLLGERGGVETPTKFLERAGLDTTLLFRGGLVGKRKNQENQEERFAGGVAIFTQKIT